MTTNILHLYGPTYEHDSAFIVGDREAITKLRDSLDMMLELDTSVRRPMARIDSMTSDGEGFSLGMVMVEEDWQSETWQTLLLPYSDESRITPPKQSVHPYRLFPKGAFK